jgi:hypothetical protein
VRPQGGEACCRRLADASGGPGDEHDSASHRSACVPRGRAALGHSDPPGSGPP